MEKTIPTPKTEVEQLDAPGTEPNGLERSPTGEDEKAHSHEPERVVEWGGPNGRYGKVWIDWISSMTGVVEYYFGEGGLQGSFESH